MCRIDCLACHEKFSMSNLLDVKENDLHVVGFALHLSYLFWSR
jgi:hypothetical protein